MGARATQAALPGSTQEVALAIQQLTEDTLKYLQRLPKVLTYTGDAPLGPPVNVVRVQHFCEPL